jgi:hypothetical protein
MALSRVIAKRWNVGRLDIRVIETPISRLEGNGAKLKELVYRRRLPPAKRAFSPGQYQRSPIAEQLGCEFCEGNNCIQWKTPRRTFWRLCRGKCQSWRAARYAAAAEGMQAAFAINSALLEADAASNALRDHEPGQSTLRIAPRPDKAVD